MHDLFSNFGAAQVTGGLNLLANLIGKPGKNSIDGSKVQDMYDAGRAEEINDYCRCDVLDTYFVFLRSRVLLGKLVARGGARIVAETKQWLEQQAETQARLSATTWTTGATGTRRSRSRDQGQGERQWARCACLVILLPADGPKPSVEASRHPPYDSAAKLARYQAVQRTFADGIVRQAQAGAEKDHPAPEDRRPRHLQGGRDPRRGQARAVRIAARSGRPGRQGGRRDRHRAAQAVPRPHRRQRSRLVGREGQAQIDPEREGQPVLERQRPPLSAQAVANRADGDPGRRRQRLGQDDLDLQARQAGAKREQKGAAWPPATRSAPPPSNN